MDEGARKNKGIKKASGRQEKTRPREMYERRPLKTVNLSPPDYHINPQILHESYVEKEVRFAGIIQAVPPGLDATNRTEVLLHIDRGKREDVIPWRMTYDHDAIFCLSVQNVKISKRDGKEELLLRIPIHEIAAICYIKDDNQHIISIKSGNPEEEDGCQLAVMYCDTRTAEELCALVGQCFELVYTDATMQLLDMNLETTNSMSLSSSNITTSTTTTRSEHSNSNKSTPTTKRQAYESSPMSFMTQSQQDLYQPGFNTISTTSRSLSRRKQSQTPSQDSELSASAKDLLQQYMTKLQKKLNSNELHRFAQLLKAYHTNLPLTDFCEKVLELYGPDRKYLLAGMRPFIPERDYPHFESFLERVGAGNGNGTWSEPANSNSRKYRRTLSGNSSYSNNGNANGDEYDRILSDISGDIENLEVSVDINTNPESFLPKST